MELNDFVESTHNLKVTAIIFHTFIDQFQIVIQIVGQTHDQNETSNGQRNDTRDEIEHIRDHCVLENERNYVSN